MRLAVTGATGFLGRRVVAMAAGRGHRVVATSSGRTPFSGGAETAGYVAADITDVNALARVFDGCDAVVHAAALSSDWGPAAEFRRVNVEGTRAVVAAAHRAGVGRLVHVSSTSVYFAFADRCNLAEDAPLPEPVNAYARSKRDAEAEALRFPGAVFVARPRGLFGPGDPHLLPRLLSLGARRPLPLLRGGRALVDITEVGVAADAVLAMAEAGEAAAGTYNVSHGEPIGVRDLVERLFAGLRRPLLWRAVPLRPALAAARLLEWAARLDPRGRPPLVTAYSLGLLAYSQTLDIGRARERLSWRPPLALSDAIERTIAAARGSA